MKQKKPKATRAKASRKFCGCNFALVTPADGVPAAEASKVAATYKASGLNTRTTKAPKGVRVYAKAETAGTGDSCHSYYWELANIQTDTKRFQNRKSEFSEESVEKIVKNYDPNKMDPITIWKDPRNGVAYVLSGHSRYEAHKKLKFRYIPVRIFEGTEAQAIQYGKVDANRSGTPETLLEDIAAYSLQRDGDTARGIPPMPKDDLRNKWGKRYAQLEAYSYLNPKGKWLEILGQEARKQFPYIDMKASWVGLIRRVNPKITNAHENELFTFLMQGKGVQMKKDEFMAALEKVVTRLDWDPASPLNLDKAGKTGTYARADTAESQRRINDIDKELVEIRSRMRKSDLTIQEKQVLIAVVKRLMEEKERLERGISLTIKTQTSLF